MHIPRFEYWRKHCGDKGINQSALAETDQKLKIISLALLAAIEGKQEGIAKFYIWG